MSPEKWRYFRYAFVAFVLVACLMVYDQGGFTSMGLVGLGILLLALTAVGVALYFFVRDEPDGPFNE